MLRLRRYVAEATRRNGKLTTAIAFLSIIGLIIADVLHFNTRVRALESQVHELESETAKLLHAFETQKTLTAEAETLVRKKTEEAAKDLAQKVSCRLRCLPGREADSCEIRQASETDAFKQKIKQYSDYDEVKRELEIMKVRATIISCCIM